MHINSIYLKKYYHLEEFKIDFHQPISVLIGENGSGKSTLLEGIVEIFRNLYYTESLPIPFEYIINYELSNHEIEISTLSGVYEIKIDKTPVDILTIQQNSKTWIYKKIPEKLEGLLPDNILMYYSGQSNRINKHFEKIENDYQEALKNGFDMGIKPLFLFQPIHGKIILLGLLASKLDGIKKFLKENFSIAGLDSFEIHLKKPDWSSSNKAKLDNFWNAQKIVAEYLSQFKAHATDEIKLSNEKLVLRYYPGTKLDEIINLSFVGYESNLVKILDSLNSAGFIENIQIQLILVDGKRISFENLSEGEQQLIAIKGMTELLRGQETLYLLDEPDNYLHPTWQESLLEELSAYKSNTHFFITTHSPQLLTNANTEYCELFILTKGKLEDDVPQYFGKDVNSILSNLMYSKYRNGKITQMLDSMFQKIALKDISTVELEYSELVKILGEDDPKMVAAKSEIDFIKFENHEVNPE